MTKNKYKEKPALIKFLVGKQGSLAKPRAKGIMSKKNETGREIKTIQEEIGHLKERQFAMEDIINLVDVPDRDILSLAINRREKLVRQIEKLKEKKKKLEKGV